MRVPQKAFSRFVRCSMKKASLRDKANLRPIVNWSGPFYDRSYIGPHLLKVGAVRGKGPCAEFIGCVRATGRTTIRVCDELTAGRRCAQAG